MMGGILEPTPDMYPWRVEIRRESAYVRGGALLVDRPTTPPADGPTARGLGIAWAELPGFVAALDQIIASDPYQAHEAEPSGWSAHGDGGPVLWFFGDLWATPARHLPGWAGAEQIELEYAGLAKLREIAAAELGIPKG